MKLTILGCFAATPRSFANSTSQVLETKNHLFLIDCAEGTQVELRKHKIRFSKITHVFISHLHGDHFFGLPGLISSFKLLGRTSPLHIYGPKNIGFIIDTVLSTTLYERSFPLIYHELESENSERIFEDNGISVDTIPLKHRIYANGFLFKEKEQNLSADTIKKCDTTIVNHKKVIQDKDITINGDTIPNSSPSLIPSSSLYSYAYCSDTAYSEKIIPIIKNVNVLYHESTFLESHKHLTQKTGHSTAKQAAKTAEKANVSLLILGHYSSRYPKIDAFKEEAEELFKNSVLGDDGKVFVFEDYLNK